ncbi:hypothetical protein [Caballeronia sp. HLA56]
MPRTDKDGSDLHVKLSVLIGSALRVDIARLRRDELFVDVIPNFDSLVILEIILLIEEREGLQFDRYLQTRNVLATANAEGSLPVFPPNISALVRAVLQAKKAESCLLESEMRTTATNLTAGLPESENNARSSIRDGST